ncbi:MAG: hypothetical protein RHS_5905 [Robinsoniella sp. RHS]|uniref:recombinase family protein n=1 Tax=Robinsoniella sp. RHS TaxID=1504536 RepID=UPI00064B3781|nr:MAG: hypothetical protein RHS_5905 [Robinsoniella sp. RHS]
MIAGYVRKSVYSDTGDSIENQKNIIKDYVQAHFESAETAFYEDEGFTGSNTMRPGFQQMLSDIHNNKIDTVICYKLDRISRSVLDFSETFADFQIHNVDFVSVKEQVDTSTPIGRAMMYISSVFAQMERETIAERVRDNLVELAKTGKWAGGKAPVGYKIERQLDHRNKYYSVLVRDPEGEIFLNKIIETFLSGKTLSGMETYFRANGIKSPTGGNISTVTIHQILRNPQYVSASPEMWDYFNEKGCIMAVPREDFDSTAAIIAYNRTSETSGKHINNPVEKWIITKGMHEPLITPDIYLAIQKRFGINKISKSRKYDIGLLRGKLKCSCGRTMSAKRKIDYSIKSRPVYWYYICTHRNRGKGNCAVKQVGLFSIDDEIVGILRNIQHDPSCIEKYIRNRPKVIDTRKSIASEIKLNKEKVDNLVSQLANNKSSAAAKYIISSIEEIDSKIENLTNQFRDMESQIIQNKRHESDVANIVELISKKMILFDTWNYEDQKNFIADIIEECTWDGDQLRVTFI